MSKLPDVGTTIFTVMSRRATEQGAVNVGQGFPDYPIDPELAAEPAALQGLDAFVVREADLRFETDFYHEYVVAPAPMIAEAVANALAQSGAFAKVIPPGAPPEAELTIDAFVGSLYADNRDPKAPAAELAITFYVSRTDRVQAPMWTKSYLKRKPLSTVSAELYVAAQSASLGEILAELARDLAEQRFSR